MNIRFYCSSWYTEKANGKILWRRLDITTADWPNTNHVTVSVHSKSHFDVSTVSTGPVPVKLYTEPQTVGACRGGPDTTPTVVLKKQLQAEEKKPNTSCSAHFSYAAHRGHEVNTELGKDWTFKTLQLTPDQHESCRRSCGEILVKYETLNLLYQFEEKILRGAFCRTAL